MDETAMCVRSIATLTLKTTNPMNVLVGVLV